MALEKPKYLESTADLVKLMEFHGVTKWSVEDLAPGYGQLRVPPDKRDAVDADVQALRPTFLRIDVVAFRD